MQLPHQHNETNSSHTELETEFEQALTDVRKSLVELQQRYAQIQADKQRQIELKHRREEIKPQLRKNPLPELKSELLQIQQQLETLDNALGLMSDSYLTVSFFGGGFVFSKTGLQEAFWQVIRFGGLGVIIGWILKSVVG
ncbi:FIG00872702: hypothetical protein [Richelia intracellularis]|nr:FIG00872702: hypothetical protein [Richelia intracellularis]